MKEVDTFTYILQGLIFTICIVVSCCMLVYISTSRKPRKYRERPDTKRFPGVAFRVCNYHVPMIPKGLIAILVTDGSCDLCSKKIA